MSDPHPDTALIAALVAAQDEVRRSCDEMKRAFNRYPCTNRREQATSYGDANVACRGQNLPHDDWCGHCEATWIPVLVWRTAKANRGRARAAVTRRGHESMKERNDG